MDARYCRVRAFVILSLFVFPIFGAPHMMVVMATALPPAPSTSAPPTPAPFSSPSPPTQLPPTSAPRTIAPLTPAPYSSPSPPTQPPLTPSPATISPVATSSPVTPSPVTMSPTPSPTTDNAFYVLLMPNTTEVQMFARLVAALNTTTSSVNVFARGLANVSQSILFVDIAGAPPVVTLGFVNFTFVGNDASLLLTRCNALDVSFLVSIGVAFGVSYVAVVPSPTRSPSVPLFTCRLLSGNVTSFRANLANLVNVTTDSILIVAIWWELMDGNLSASGASLSLRQQSRSLVTMALVNYTKLNFTFTGSTALAAANQLQLFSTATLLSIGIDGLQVVIPAITASPAPGSTSAPSVMPSGSGGNDSKTPLIVGLSVGGGVVLLIIVFIVRSAQVKAKTIQDIPLSNGRLELPMSDFPEGEVLPAASLSLRIPSAPALNRRGDFDDML